MIRYTFTKSEKLKDKKKIDLLFKTEKGFIVSPLRVIWLETTCAHLYPVQLGISVPKKKIAKSVDRNTIKRKIRESYRKNKQSLYEILRKKNRCIVVMIIYMYRQELPYKEIEKKMIVSLQKLGHEI